MMKNSIPHLLSILIFIAIHLFPITVSSQHRIPKEGENIQFFPIVDEQRVIHTGYDCFYSEDLVCLEGGYINFKNKYRFKKRKDKLTPLAEIENYTFFVREVKDFSSNSGKELLIFLTRNEDGEKVILRLKLESSKGNNFLSNAMFEYKKIYNGIDLITGANRYKYVIERINLPYINSDSLKIFKERYSQNNIVSTTTIARDIMGNVIGGQLEKDYDNLVEIINKKNCDFNQGTSYYCMDIGFQKTFEESINKVPCARLKSSNGEFIDIPLCYFDKVTEDIIYLIPRLFVTEERYKQMELARAEKLRQMELARVKKLRQMELARYDLQSLIDEYVGKYVYYGLDNTLTDEKQKFVKIVTAENINEIYKLTEGRYKSVDFVVNSDIEKGLLARETVKKYPYAILEDSLGIRFKVRINDEDYKDNKKNCFEKYFTHANIADSITAERERIKFENALRQMKRLMDLEKEFGKDTGFLLLGCSDEEVDRFRGLKKEFGEKYGLYLIKRSNEDVDRFRRLKKKYGAINAIAILGKGYAIGWTEDMIRESLGIPYDINRSVGSWGVHEQWIYRMDYKTIYIYFENGKVRSFQD